jgi:hypothetical protein
MKKCIAIFALIGLLSCEEIINEVDITKDSVELLAPANSVTLTVGDIAFIWQDVPDATNYKLQIAQSNFSNATQIVMDTLIQRTGFSIDSLTTGHYEWRVKALNSAYETVYTTNGFVVVEP